MSGIRFVFVFLAAIISLSGCATPDGGTAAALHIRSIEDDQFSKNVVINGAEVYVNPFGGTFRSWFIRSWVDKKTHAVSHQLYVDISYIGQWEFFSFAADDTAKTLDVTKINSKVGDCFGGCSLSETIGISLDDSILRSRVTNGYQIKVSAKSGDSLILPISPEQIRLQMAAVDQYLK